VYLRCKECNSCPPAGDGSLQQQLIMVDFVPTTNWLLTTYELHVELQLSIPPQLMDVISSSAELTATLKPRSRRTKDWLQGGTLSVLFEFMYYPFDALATQKAASLFSPQHTAVDLHQYCHSLPHLFWVWKSSLCRPFGSFVCSC
jgi:hypothetical protein